MQEAMHGLVVKGEDFQQMGVVGSNPGAGYWMECKRSIEEIKVAK